MKVRLRRDWFAPDATLYRRTPRYEVTLIPRAFRQALPKDVDIVDENDEVDEVAGAEVTVEAAPQVPVPVPTPAELDFERGNAETVDATIEARLAAATKQVKKKKE